MIRGGGSFDPARLISELDRFTPVSGPKQPASIGDYYAFYDLDFSGEFSDLNHSIGRLVSGGYTITAQHFHRAGATGTAVVCHGYYDHVGLYGHLVRWLLGCNLSVLTFDLPGHGLSSGPSASINSFDEYVTALVDTLSAADGVLSSPVYLLGQSMGGAVCMEYLMRADARRFEEIVLFAPLIRPANWPLANVFYQLARHFVSERPRTITDNAENAEFMSLMRVDPLAPEALPVAWVSAMIDWMKRFATYTSLPFEPKVVQGCADKTVDWKYGLRVLHERTSPEVLEIEPARHHLVNESPEIRQQMFEWLDPFLRTGR